MKEDFVHYVWQYQQFDISSARLNTNEKLKIISVGNPNQDAGPDFLNATIQVDDIQFVGNVEIHLKSSDWFAHKHHLDKNYDNVILHVVWTHDIDIPLPSGNSLLTLELKSYTYPEIYNKYKKTFLNKSEWIPCENNINLFPDFQWANWKERLYIERLEQKTSRVYKLLEASNNNWEEVCFYLIAQSFGLKINTDSFFEIAKKTSFNIVRKVAQDAIDLEALFFGQGMLLEKEIDNTYYKELKKRYAYLKKKYHLTPTQNVPQFFRLRPPNFPTIRLSQLAQLYVKHQNLFSDLIHIKDIEKLKDLFKVEASPFWKNHYTFEKESPISSKKVSLNFILILVINTLIPLRFTYEKYIGKLDAQNLLSFVQELPPEENTITKKFKQMKIGIKNALDSQSVIELKNKYCDQKKCLKCSVGHYLLKNN